MVRAKISFHGYCQWANLNAKNKHGKTPLCAAAALGYDDIASLLIERGADLDVRDQEGRTAIYYAAQTRNLALMKLLYQAGADIYLTHEIDPSLVRMVLLQSPPILTC